MALRPLHDRVIVRLLEQEEKKKRRNHHSGHREREAAGREVVAVAHGKRNKAGQVFPLEVKAGDRILFGKYSGTEIKLDGEDFLILREDEILAMIEAAKKK